ncbi:hypothetical protein K1719_020407 [Acacia pycnantha]|nr:hypothetical protein K1719_020407 [Acacia pycnantha]
MTLEDNPPCLPLSLCGSSHPSGTERVSEVAVSRTSRASPPLHRKERVLSLLRYYDDAAAAVFLVAPPGSYN